MRYANPAAFWLLLLPLLYFLVYFWRGKQTQGLPLPGFQLLKEIKTGWIWQRHLPGLLYLLGVILVIFALARPQMGQEIVKRKQQGIDIILALDTSGSMQAQDFRPNRLEAAKAVISDFTTLQSGNRLGVVVFAGRSFTLMPLTTDYQLVVDSIKDIHAQIVAVDGTAIGDAIANALYRFKDDNKKSRVIILLTDGDNNSGHIKPMVAAEVAKQKNVRIYTIGMGKPEGAPIPYVDRRTGQVRYYRDPRTGQLVLTSINEKDLVEISRITGGLYFQADNQDKLSAIYNQIAQMEKAEFEVKRSTLYHEQMVWFLLPALLLFLISYTLSHTVARVLRV